MISAEKTLPLWDLRTLKIFVLTAEAGSITRVAIDLGLSQPAVSRYLSNLEKDCRGYLFIRHGRGVELTELGRKILPLAIRTLEGAQNISDAIDNDHITGLVRIAIIPSLTKSILSPLFFYLKENYPGIQLKIIEGAAGQIETWLRLREVDIGIPYKSHQVKDWEDEVMCRLPSFLVGAVGDTVTAQAETPFAALNDLPLVLSAKPSSFRNMLEEMGGVYGVKINVIMEADSGVLQKEVAAKRGGYTILPWHTIKNEVDAGVLQASRITDPELIRVISMNMPQNNAKAVRIVRSKISKLFEDFRRHYEN